MAMVMSSWTSIGISPRDLGLSNGNLPRSSAGIPEIPPILGDSPPLRVLTTMLSMWSGVLAPMGCGVFWRDEQLSDIP
ncbi:MAG: hypothetical protein Q4F53_03405 [Nesterenkonia sp.]|nr:hypothetical protein [Nesterenkonia sp.]